MFPVTLLARLRGRRKRKISLKEQEAEAVKSKEII
jgi:hypothetical protein